jgi:peptidoglycan-associated lipoprotein
MSRQRISRYQVPGVVTVLCALGAAGGCSHQQPPPQVPTPVPAVAAAPRAAAPATHSAASAPPAARSVSVGKTDKELAVFFDFDSALLRDDAHPVLQKVAGVAERRNVTVRIEGNCDEVGTVEYNLALGEHRAIQAKDYLTRLGVPSERIKTVSYGSQRPKAPGHDDEAHAENRRDDLIVN